MSRRDAPVTPGCCAEVERHGTVRLRMDGAYYYTEGGAPEGLVPEWQVRARRRDEEEESTVGVGAAFCPHCAAPVPEVRRKAHPPKEVCVVTDGGYYCDTCQERLMCCECHPPEHLFEVAR